MSTSDKRRGLTRTEWLICIMASIGFAFDIYELLMLPLVVKPAVMELVPATIEFEKGTPEFAEAMRAAGTTWRARMFYIPALVGGLFGMLGGYLTDWFGRRRVLTWSILLYATSAFAAGFSTSLEMLLILRCLTFAGVCVEFVAAVAWLAELFPDFERRERVLGYTQAFSSIGGLMVTGVFLLLVAYAEYLPAIYGEHAVWRYLLMSGLIPAFPLIVIRPFLPESPIWSKRRREGTLARPSIAAVFAPAYRRATVVTIILFACSYGAAFGALQQVPQIVPGMVGVRDLESASDRETMVGRVQTLQEIGGLVGRLLLAFLAVHIVSRQRLLRMFQIPGLLLLPVVFVFFATSHVYLLMLGVFLVGLCTVGQFSFLGNYIPLAYPTHLRGTGESCGANIGGRILGTMGAAVATYLEQWMPGDTPSIQLAHAAAVVGGACYLIGFIVSFWLPEPVSTSTEE